MPTESITRRLPLPARRVFRLGLTVALTLAASYALARPLPYLAPIFALVLTGAPTPPMPVKPLIGLMILVLLTAGTGLLLVPVLLEYPAVGLIVVALGLYLSNDLSMNRGKAAVGTFLTIGLTLITAAGVGNFVAALTVAKELIVGIGLAILCHRIVHPFFPEDPVRRAPPPKPALAQSASAWLAARTTLIVFPAYLLGLINPGLYLPIIMKSVSLGQQSSEVHTRRAGRELLLSTFLGGFYAMLFWFGLKLLPNLWMFFLWMILFGSYFASKLYGVSASRYPPSTWTNVLITTLILVGPAVADSASGKDVYRAFAVRMALFVAVTVYAWAAMITLEHLRAWRASRKSLSPSTVEVS